MTVLRWTTVVLLSAIMSFGAVAQEYCPPPPSDPAKPKVAEKKTVLPEDFKVQTIDGDPALPPLVFVGDSLVGGYAAPEKQDRVFARAAALVGNRSVTSMALSGRGSSYIATKFDAVDIPSNATLVIWAGRNNVRQPDQVISDIKAIVAHAGVQHFLVLRVPTTNNPWEAPGTKGNDAVAELNSRLETAFPQNFLSVAATTTCADRADVVHFKASGQEKIAAEIASAITRLGW